VDSLDAGVGGFVAAAFVGAAGLAVGADAAAGAALASADGAGAVGAAGVTLVAGRCGRTDAGDGPGRALVGRAALGRGELDALPDAPAGAFPPSIFSVSRRTTGGSMVDDADRTNSPMSLRVFRSSLLSSPSSFASS
jgi:hypothetical protein